MHPLRFSVPRAVVAAAALAMLVGFAPSGAASQLTSNPATARYETTFLKNMIDHHAMAVHMAQMCRPKAVHGQLRALCQNIQTGQQREINEMRSWLRAWYRTDHQPMMHMSGTDQRRMHDMQAMSGRLFEIHFMTMMIPHHEQAIREAKTCLNRAGHPQLRQLCGSIIKTQSAEIRTMRSWLCTWYNVCDGRHKRGHPHGPMPGHGHGPMRQHGQAA